jgi:transcriptional regulator with XRE-family HTH domain
VYLQIALHNICKMQSSRKSAEDPQDIGRQLRAARKALGLTLIEVQTDTGVNVGQLSRFERGEFARLSPNLQKVMGHFASLKTARSPAIDHLVARFERLLARSPKHSEAARALVTALERFP